MPKQKLVEIVAVDSEGHKTETYCPPDQVEKALRWVFYMGDMVVTVNGKRVDPPAQLPDKINAESVRAMWLGFVAGFEVARDGDFKARIKPGSATANELQAKFEEYLEELNRL